MYRNFAFAAAAVIVSASGAAFPQDYSLEPTFGAAELENGFVPDPYEVTITSGGMIDAAGIGCAGMIADAPDFRLNYVAGDDFPLILSVESDDDTTLVVNLPDESWACADDTENSLNPAITLDTPMTGQYDIWVGSYDGNFEESTLFISEVMPFSLGAGMTSDDEFTAPDFSLEPGFGSIELVTGFEEDPYNVELTSGGPIDAASVGCVGMVAAAPDFRLYYTAGEEFPLILSVMSEFDTTLVVNAPDGNWICDDDSGENMNPSISLDAPMSGQYDIWVGSYAGDFEPATLTISEIMSR